MVCWSPPAWHLKNLFPNLLSIRNEKKHIVEQQQHLRRDVFSLSFPFFFYHFGNQQPTWGFHPPWKWGKLHTSNSVKIPLMVKILGVNMELLEMVAQFQRHQKTHSFFRFDMWDIRQVRRQASLAAQQQRKNLEQKKWLEEKAVKTVEVRGSWLDGWGCEDDWRIFFWSNKNNCTTFEQPCSPQNTG